MRNTEDIFRAITYIEENLKNNLSVEMVANHTGYSLYYFSRMFSKTTGHSPYDYIIRRRLSNAVVDFKKTDKKIIEIALDYQFNNPETFSRAFSKMFNQLPSKIKKNNNFDNLILKTPISLEYLNYINDPGLNVEIKIIRKAEMNLIGVIKNSEDISHDFINIFIKKAANNFMQTRDKVFFLIFNPVDYSKQHALLLAVETNCLDIIPPTCVAKNIPAQKYARLIITTNTFKTKHIFKYIYETKLKNCFKEKPPYLIIEPDKSCYSNNQIQHDRVMNKRTFYIPLD